MNSPFDTDYTDFEKIFTPSQSSESASTTSDSACTEKMEDNHCTTTTTTKTVHHKYCPGFQPHDSETIPWQDNSYVIYLNGTRMAITLTEVGVCLKDTTEDGIDRNDFWRCVEEKGYFGFYNQESMKYLGHDNHNNLCATAPHLKGWEFFIPRQHPSGGYQLLQSCGGELLVLGVSGEKLVEKLVLKRHHDTTWKFEKV